MNSHIYCDNCEEIRPVALCPMDGDDVSGKFNDAVDLKCDECHFIVATMFNPKAQEAK